MLSRLRSILTAVLLLTFSADNMANSFIDINADTFSSVDQYHPQKGKLTSFSWIMEENESEEKSDDKMHGPILIFDGGLRDWAPDILSVSRLSPHMLNLTAGTPVLRLICRLDL